MCCGIFCASLRRSMVEPPKGGTTGVKTAVFFGTPEIARAPLAALAKSDFAKVIAVVSQPDRPSGRDLKVQPTPDKTLAQELGIPLLQPDRARNPEFVAELRS